MNVKRVVQSLFVALCVSAFVACSGGDSSGSTSNSTVGGGGGGGGGTGTAALTWNGPSTNADTTPLADLAGYRVYRSSVSGQYNNPPVATVAAGSASGGGTGITTTINNLASGTYYFVVRAYDSSGNESANALPGEVSKTIP